MSRWIPSIGLGRSARRRPGGRESRPGGPGPLARRIGWRTVPERAPQPLELLVREGPDAGSQFTVDGASVRLGRGARQTGRPGAIGLLDRSVSPHQATLHVGERGAEIEHCENAAHPTRVNGRIVERCPVRVGDRIEMGATVFEVRARTGTGTTLSNLFAVEDPEPGSRGARSPSTTEIRENAPTTPELVLLRGVPGLVGQRFPLSPGTCRIGRHPSNDIVLNERGVSRFHAELVWEGGSAVLVHKSATNASKVDGRIVADRYPLGDGQVIQLADRVALRVDLPAGEGRQPTEPREVPARRSPVPDRLEEQGRRHTDLERALEFAGSFLDLDVVDSYGLKVGAKRPAHIIVSFERFRSFAQTVIEDHGGQVLNSNGDELMCFFDKALPAVRAARAVLERLAGFNEHESLLDKPFRVRQGIHTGACLLDRDRGVSYSPVLDVAGHLQKHAPVDGLLVSDATLAHLPEALPFDPVGPVGREEVAAFRWSGN